MFAANERSADYPFTVFESLILFLRHYEVPLWLLIQKSINLHPLTLSHQPVKIRDTQSRHTALPSLHISLDPIIDLTCFQVKSNAEKICERSTFYNHSIESEHRIYSMAAPHGTFHYLYLRYPTIGLSYRIQKISHTDTH